MLHPHAYATYVEIAAAQHMFAINIHIVAGQVGPPDIPTPNTCYIRYSAEHYQSLIWQLLPP